MKDSVVNRSVAQQQSKSQERHFSDLTFYHIVLDLTIMYSSRWLIPSLNPTSSWHQGNILLHLHAQLTHFTPWQTFLPLITFTWPSPYQKSDSVTWHHCINAILIENVFHTLGGFTQQLWLSLNLGTLKCSSRVGFWIDLAVDKRTSLLHNIIDYCSERLLVQALSLRRANKTLI